MLISMSPPVSAQIIQAPLETADVTGGAGPVGIVSVVPSMPEEPLPTPSGNDGADVIDDSIFISTDILDTEEDTTAPGQSSPETSDGGYFHLDVTPEEAERIIAFFEFAKGRIENQPMFMPFAAPGDTGTVTWSWGEYVGISIGDYGIPYYINNIVSLNLSTANMPIGKPFCVQFNTDPGGNYTASQGTNNQVLRLLIAYHNGQASAVGVQLALWAIVDGISSLLNHPEAAATIPAMNPVTGTPTPAPRSLPVKAPPRRFFPPRAMSTAMPSVKSP